jgi:hypothetical protein
VGVEDHGGEEDGHITWLSSAVIFVSAVASHDKERKKRAGTRPSMLRKGVSTLMARFTVN